MTTDLGPGALIDGYRLMRLLGRGAQSRVYLAEHIQTSHVVALKMCPLPTARVEDEVSSAQPPSAAPTGAAERNRRTAILAFEGITAAVMRLPAHPHIVSVLAAGVNQGWAWLAMEPVIGGDLQRYTRPARLLPEPLVLRLAQQIAAALSHAHRHGIVHRDLKPSNVLLHLPTGILKLADFGLARSADAEPTATGMVPGTPAYMAPEQLAGQPPTARSDLYALGVILYELLTGRRPHEASSMGELLRQVASQPATELASLRPDLPEPLCQLVRALLQKRSSERLGDADVAAESLARILESTGQSGPVAQ